MAKLGFIGLGIMGVSGGQVGAEKATLSIMVGGKPKVSG